MFRLLEAIFRLNTKVYKCACLCLYVRMYIYPQFFFCHTS